MRLSKTAWSLIFAAALIAASVCLAHTTDKSVDAQVTSWLSSLPGDLQRATRFEFTDDERFDFGWTPGRREGARLDDLTGVQRDALRDIFRTVLSEAGARKVDAIIATEAALAVIESAPDYRDPNKYWTAVFGEPGPGMWGLRFEGHHLSVNLTFRGARLVSATPLFLGANPERIPVGPDAGLRALAAEVDLAWELVESLSAEQFRIAQGSGEWFGGFLTSAGDRRAKLGKPAGIDATALTGDQQALLRRLVAAYVDTIAASYATPYLEQAVAEEWPHLRFHWRGAKTRGDNYYYRIAGRRLLIEHENRSGGSHVHAVWRDAEQDFGGQ